MARLKFNGVAIGNARGFATTAKSTTGTVADGIATIQRCMQSEVASRNNIAYRLSNIQLTVAQAESDIQAIYQMVDSASTKYNNAERQIVGWVQQVANGYRPNNYSSNRDAFAITIAKATYTRSEIVDNGIKTKWGDVLVNKSSSLLKKMVGKVGFIGGAVKVGADFISAVKSDSRVKMGTALVAGGKSFTTLLGDLTSNAFEEPKKQNWKKAFVGDWDTHPVLKNITKSTTVTGKIKNLGTKWKEAIIKEKISYELGDVTEVSKNMKVATKWAGVVFSLASNGIENYDEYKRGDIDEGRYVAETFTETAVDIAVGAVITATVVGAAAAIGVAAPAVVVGVVATGVTWLLDEAVEVKTGKSDLTELISDGILDKGEEVIGGIGSAIRQIGVKWEKCFG